MKTKIIAEVSSNHGGDINIAKEFVRTAAKIGIDYIKFQSWQAKNYRGERQKYDWYKKSELTDQMHYELLEEAEKSGIKFLTTVFDVNRVEFLESLGLKEIKVGSADTSNYKLIERLAKSEIFEHIIISTGMHYINEIEKTAQIMKESGKKFTFMHCVSLYPTPIEKVRLRRMLWLKKFTPSVGYSDHTIGTLAAEMAIAMGADYVEKHFTLGEGKCPRSMPWDATPEDFEKLINFREKFNIIFGESEDMDILPEEIESRKVYIGLFSGEKNNKNL